MHLEEERLEEEGNEGGEFGGSRRFQKRALRVETP